MQYLNEFIDKWNGDYTKLLAYILALAVFTMALLQLLNDLTPFRAFSHMFLVRSWITKRVRLYKAEAAADTSDIETEKALGQLVAHATGGDWRALFGLPPSQLVAQINAAAQGALDNPQANYALIAVLSQPANSSIPLILGKGRTTGNIKSHLDDLKNLRDSQVPESTDDAKRAAVESATAEAGQHSERLQRYAEVRALIAHRIQRNLDGMQIGIANTGAVVIQILAIVIAVGICYLIARDGSMSGSRDSVTPVSIASLSVLLIGISAGYLAPVLGDIVAAIRRFGRAP
jgi:hypothetical protein